MAGLDLVRMKTMSFFHYHITKYGGSLPLAGNDQGRMKHNASFMKNYRFLIIFVLVERPESRGIIMKNSAIIIDINVRKNIVAWASLKTNDPTHVKRSASQAIAGEPIQVQLIRGVSDVLKNIQKAREEKKIGENDRVSIIVPESIYLRMVQACGLAINPNRQLLPRQQIIQALNTKMYQAWMRDASFNVTYNTVKGGTVVKNAWQSAIGEFANVFASAFKPGLINFVNSRTLYRYELTSVAFDEYRNAIRNTKDPQKLAPVTNNIDELLKGVTEVTLANSEDTKLGVHLTENNFINGTFKVTKTSYRSNNGTMVNRYYVNREIRVDKEGNPLYPSGKAVLIARALRIKNAEQLPLEKVVTVQDMVAEQTGTI